jgi:hypothetical protein
MKAKGKRVLKPPRCPQCNAPGKPIMYGYPLEEAIRQAERGEIVLGGCVITDHDPQWQCSHGHKWGKQK